MEYISSKDVGTGDKLFVKNRTGEDKSYVRDIALVLAVDYPYAVVKFLKSRNAGNIDLRDFEFGVPSEEFLKAAEKTFDIPEI